MQEYILKNILEILLSAIGGYAIAMYRQNIALKKGMQSLLRDRIIQAYNHYHEDKCYMPIYAKQSFEALYKSYHNLGENGVVDTIYEKVMSLPTSKEE